MTEISLTTSIIVDENEPTIIDGKFLYLYYVIYN